MNTGSTHRRATLVALSFFAFTLAATKTLNAEDIVDEQNTTISTGTDTRPSERSFVYPPGYMDRSPKEHRTVTTTFCENCDMDLSKAEQFKTRASVVNRFKLTSTNGLSIDGDDAGSKK